MRTVVIVTRSRWSDLPRIRHQVARALSPYCRILFVETPPDGRHGRRETVLEEVEPNITRCSLGNRRSLPVKIRHYFPFAHAFVEKTLLEELHRVLRIHAGGELILLNFNYDNVALMRSSLFALKIYFCNDDFVGAVSNLVSRMIVKKRQARVAARADLCLAVSYSLVNELQVINPETHLLLPGHDFKMARTPTDLRCERVSGGEIKVGFMGALDEGINASWLEHAARQPDLEVHLVGPLENNRAIAALIRDKFCIYYEPKYGEALQEFLESMDVLVVPFDLSLPAIRKITAPNKLFQYIAAGKPVVISDMPNFVKFEENGVLYRAFSRETFVEQIRAAREEDCAQFRETRLRIAANNSWEKKGKELFHIIEERIANLQRYRYG